MMDKQKLFKFWKILFILMGFLFLLNPIFSKAAIPGAEGVTLSPPITELTINPGEQATGTIKLTNPLDKQIELYTSTIDFLPEGETGGQKYIPATKETNKFSLASWITIMKSKVALTPEEVENIEYTISVPKDAEPGGHYGVIFFSSQPPEPEEGLTQIAIGSQVGALMLVRVPGDIIEKATLETFTAPWMSLKTPIDFLVRIGNQGNVHFKPMGDIKIKNWRGITIDNVKINQGGGNVLPDSIRRFEEKWEPKNLQIGRFTADLGLIYGEEGKQSLSREIVFWIIPWWLWLILGLILTLIIYLIIRWWKKRKKRQPSASMPQKPILR